MGQMDKLMHFSAFLSIAVSAALASGPTRHSAWAIAAALLGYGALIEIAQIWIPGRDASWLDLLADALGIACGLSLAFALRRWGPLRQPR